MIIHLTMGSRPLCGAKGRRERVDGEWRYADATPFIGKATCHDCLRAGMDALVVRQRQLGRSAPVLLDAVGDLGDAA